MKVIVLFVCAVVGIKSQAQKSEPLYWEVAYKSFTATTGEIHWTAVIDKPWHIYAQFQPKSAISQPTKIVVNSNPLIILTPGIKELGEKETYKNKEVGITQYQYGGKVEFVQQVKLKAKIKTNLSGTITYQACNDELCLPVKTIPFNVKIE